MKRPLFFCCRLVNILIGKLIIPRSILLKLKNKGYELYNTNHLRGEITFIFKDVERTGGYAFVNKCRFEEIEKLS